MGGQREGARKIKRRIIIKILYVKKSIFNKRKTKILFGRWDIFVRS